MIYVICATQTITVACLVLAVRWGLNYLEDRDKGYAVIVSAALDHAKRVDESSQEAIRAIVERSNEQVQQVMDKAYRDREILCERIQHPEYMKAQAPSADKGAKAKPYTMDEEREFEIEHPDAPTQELPGADEIIPGARREDEEIKPVEAVTPFGKGRSDNGSTE